MRTGPHNALTDVQGLRVGHAAMTEPGGLSGTTVVLAPREGVIGGVDVRGAAPGTRETDLLDPRSTVQRLHAVVLSGGSAYGLAAADGVMARLEAAGVGLKVPDGVVPIVPAAVIFDLGRGGNFRARPNAATGLAAADAASDGPVTQGVVGAGMGAVVGGLKGGVGTASAVLGGGDVVAALVVVNAVGSAVDLASGALRGACAGLSGEFPAVNVAVAARAALRAEATAPQLALGTATTLAVIATDVTLDKAGCARLAGMGHDGIARAISPSHTVMDGDTVFGLSTAARPALGLPDLGALQGAAADVTSRAIAHALLAAHTVRTPVRTWRSYRDVVTDPAVGAGA